MEARGDTVPRRLPVEVTGEGPPLVLVPGGLTGWISWLPIAQRLASTRRVVRVQLLNVQLGLDGEPLPVDYSPRTEKLALAETLAGLGLVTPVDVAAWSYGGTVALDYALDHPQPVRSLTLVEPDAHWVLPSLDAEARRLRDLDLRLSREDVAEDDLERFLRDAALVPSDTEPRSLPQWPTWARHRQSLRAIPSTWGYEPDRGRIRRFPNPVLLVKGTGSVPLLHRMIDALAQQLPRAEVVEWPGGHAPHLASTDAFLERMASFQAAAGDGAGQGAAAERAPE